MESVKALLNHYGYVVLIVSLILEYIALPIPGETLMSYCGYLVFKGKLNLGLSILSAFIGTSTGITFSYILGLTLGVEFFNKYGKYIHMGPKKLEKVSNWFGTHGSKLLIISYFIPGVRHISGYFSGITKISYKRFAVNAYLGALLWTCTFILLGKFLGHNWSIMHNYIRKYMGIIGIVIGIIIILIIIRKYYFKSIKIYVSERIINKKYKEKN